jgi:hypothetical protein
MRIKTLYIVVPALLLLLASCAKNPAPTSNYWIFKQATYTADAVSYSNNGGNFITGSNLYSNAKINFSFYALPTANGTYRVVNSQFPGPNEVQVTVTDTASHFYYSTGTDNVNATVTMVKGYAGISLPKTWMISATDSAQVSARIGE